MPVSESYGDAFGKRLNARATSFLTRALPKSAIAVTELRYEDPQFILSTPPVEENAFVVAVHLQLFERYEYWQDGKAAPVSTLRPGEAIIYDVRRKPTFHLNSLFHSVHFYLPITTLHALADEAEAGRIEELYYGPAVSHADPVLRSMAEALLPAFSRPEHANRLSWITRCSPSAITSQALMGTCRPSSGRFWVGSRLCRNAGPKNRFPPICRATCRWPMSQVNADCRHLSSARLFAKVSACRRTNGWCSNAFHWPSPSCARER
jgi:hypothetical protein